MNGNGDAYLAVPGDRRYQLCRGAIMVIRVRVQNGMLRPLEPLPIAWQEGNELELDFRPADADQIDIDQWFDEMEQLGSAVYEPGERACGSKAS